MIASMTGFGRGEVKENDIEVSVEVRSLNHRFLEIDIRAPKNLANFEKEIKELIRSQLSRGRVSATINLKGEEESTFGLTLDKQLATNYLKLLKELKEELGLEGSVSLEHLFNFPDIITYENSKKVDEDVWAPVKKALELALADLREMRHREGLEIKKDLQRRIDAIGVIIEKIENRSKVRSKEELAKLKKRVQGFSGLEPIDGNRLELEVALLAEKMDVTEECIRFKSHNTLFSELLDNEESEGRKLNFLLQEMHREANTIGAKASDAEIAHWVVEVKEEVEKLREQIQNIE
ncbi:MAG: YicC/YloC family endoribonuclease [bacterium]